MIMRGRTRLIDPCGFNQSVPCDLHLRLAPSKENDLPDVLGTSAQLAWTGTSSGQPRVLVWVSLRALLMKGGSRGVMDCPKERGFGSRVSRARKYSNVEHRIALVSVWHPLADAVQRGRHHYLDRFLCSQMSRLIAVYHEDGPIPPLVHPASRDESSLWIACVTVFRQGGSVEEDEMDSDGGPSSLGSHKSSLDGGGSLGHDPEREREIMNRLKGDEREEEDLTAVALSQAESLRLQQQQFLAVHGLSGIDLKPTIPQIRPANFAHHRPAYPSRLSPSPPRSGSDNHQTWSFEEQFKQLYELSDDPKRKDFLDELFTFMAKRGQPINRLPIMAKQVLDLFELFKLVVARGGLVEVINKKLWQEVIKGLNLPSSITSAAFTLRTQYMKYLYDFECYKERLSSRDELQTAIDGNRREGRRQNYGSYSDMVQRSTGGNAVSPLPMSHPRPSMNGSSGGTPLAPAIPPGSQSALMELQARLNLYNKLVSDPSLTSTPPGIGEGDRRIISPAQTQLYDVPLNLADDGPKQPKRECATPPTPPRDSTTPSHKRNALEERNSNFTTLTAQGTHIKISSRGDNRSGTENSLVVTMEINGTLYQGVLFAQHKKVP
ncbi:unnamed protein product [Cyprideis torosa]|uniref:Uncharacterized protein n=1 Tax=Cyprideis torosa TaxID=163714 RepID=A0A7R8W5S7_9CRUS|nr:unnamed protein product [Cyprideis torosa]CAG0880739.1 unnamed protein product [Cyprideis torosa]